MNKILLALTSCVMALSFVNPVLAGVRDHHINKTQRHQERRIGEGVRSGELTKGETKDLAQDQRQIRREERQYKSDGQFTHEERKDVRQDQRDASKEIYEEKHDGETRP